jgi:chromosome segregation ATPase
VQKAIDASVAASNFQLSQLRDELAAANSTVSQLREEVDAANSSNSSKHSDSLDALDAANEKVKLLSAERDGLQGDLASAEKKIASLEADLAAALKNGGSSNSSGELSSDALKLVMQDVYTKACEMFVTDDMDDADAAAGKQSLKVLRAVLKAVSKDRSSA